MNDYERAINDAMKVCQDVIDAYGELYDIAKENGDADADIWEQKGKVATICKHKIKRMNKSIGLN